MTRRAWLVVVALAVLVGATGGSLLTTTASGAAPRPDQLRGAQLHLLWSGVSQAEVEYQLDALAATGAGSARLDVAWSSLQDTGPGRFSAGYVARLDGVVQGLAARGVRPVLVLTETPCWASTAPEELRQGCAGAYWERDVTKWAPRDPASFGQAAGWLAQRYGDRSAALELWNEPNYDDRGYATLRAPDKAAAYTAMVRAAYPAVKAVAPALPVLAGSLSFADTAFLQAVYDDGIRGFYDGLAVHPYNEWRAPGAPHDPRWAEYDLVMGLDAVRRTMLDNGDPVPVWVTELGWTTCRAGADPWCVSEQQQAAYLADALELLADHPYVRAVILYGLVDKGTDPTSTEDNFGMITQGHRAKPAVAAVTAALRRLAAEQPPGTGTGLRRVRYAE